MKKLISFLIIFTMVLTSFGFTLPAVMAAEAEMPLANGDKTVNVWLIAGQSNAMGMAEVKNYPSDEAYAGYKTLLTNGSSNVWYMATTDTQFKPTRFGASWAGPEIGIATALDSNGEMNAVIKVAWGNTSLYNNTSSDQSKTYGTWTPPTYIKNHNIDTETNKVGDLYLTFMKKIALGVSDLRDRGYTPVLKGIWYMQGEADTFSATPANAYEELLETLIYDMRADIGEITGADCSELPFVYGRVLRKDGINPDTGASYMDSTPYVPRVQEAQDAVNAKNIKNVFMINTTTDLVDPVTGEHRIPYQQDGWHYDTISQQMIGEKFVERVSTVKDTYTKYGYIPSENASLPLAVFSRDENGKTYTYDGSFETIKLAMERARTLTLASAPLTEEAVIVVLKDFSHNNYPSNMSDVGGTITIDLNGHTLTPTITLFRTDVDDCMASGETAQKKAIVNIKNGSLLVGNYGVIYNTPKRSGSTYTKVKSIEFNFDNVKLGFYEGCAGKASAFNDLLVSDINYTDSLDVNIDMSFNNCTLDLSANAKSDANLGNLNTNNPSTDKGTSKYNLTFKNCEFIANSIDNITADMSASGDSLTFIKGEDGAFGKITLPEGNYEKTYSATDNGRPVTVGLKASGEANIYNLAPVCGVSTVYGEIPVSYADSREYPLILFKKNKGEASYTFVSGYSVWKTALSSATGYIKGADGAEKEDETVILLRRDFSFSDLYTSSAIGGTLTFDLAGYTLSYGMSLMNTGNADFGTGKGGTAYINIKNGNMVCNTTYGMFYSQPTPSAYTVERGYEFNLNNVNISYGKSGTAASLLMHLNIANSYTAQTPNYTYDMILENCNIDMTKAPSGAYIAKLDKNVGSADTYGKIDNTVTIKGGSIKGVDESDIAFTTTTDGDSVFFDVNNEGKYTSIILDSDIDYPASLVFTSSENKFLVCEISKKEKLTNTYTLTASERELTPYGEIPAGYADKDAFPFALFYKDSSGGYVFSSGYATYKEAMNGAVGLTKSSLKSISDEAVVYLRCDWAGSGYPSGLSSISSKVIIDLNGYTLGALESLGNTTTGDVKDSSGNIAKTAGVIEIKNGSLLAKVHPFLYIAKSGSYTADYEKTLTVNFDNVDFGFYEGANAVALIGRVASNHTTANATFNLNFKDCLFDMVTNRPERSDVTLCNWTSASDYTIVNTIYTDCEFTGNTMSDFEGIKGENDRAVYGKTKGDYYTLLTLPESEAAPSGLYFLNDAAGRFKEVVKTDAGVVYGLFAKTAGIKSASYTKYTDYKTSTEYVTKDINPELLTDGKLTSASGAAIDYASSGNVTKYGLDSEKNKAQHWFITLDKLYTIDSLCMNYGYTNKWVVFNISVSEDNTEWVDLGDIQPQTTPVNGEAVHIAFSPVSAKYIKIKVVKRNGTNAASTATTAWGPGLGAGCTLTLYEIAVGGEVSDKEFDYEAAFSGFDKVFSQIETFTLESGEEVTAPVGIVFARANEVSGDYERIEYGVLLSLTDITKEQFKSDSSVVKAEGKKIGIGGQFGIRFYGNKIKEGETYYALPYAVYENSLGEKITVYSEAVITFRP